jgi:hypothetical protein
VVQRKIVWGPEATIVHINKDAVPMSFKPNGGDSPVYYLECRKSVEGGFIPLYVFGEGDLEALRGKKVPASVELRTKSERGQKIHYLRAEILSPTAPRPDVKLYVGSGHDSNVTLLESYPQFKGEFPRLKGGEEITKKFVIGFVSV